MRRIHLVLGQVTQDGGTAQARFTATATIASRPGVEVPGPAAAGDAEPHLVCELEPIRHLSPGSRLSQRFVLDAVWGPRAPVLAADGTVLSSPRTIAQSAIAPAGDRQRGAGHRRPGQGSSASRTRPGDPIGQGGVEEAYQQQLAGYSRPSPSASRARAAAVTVAHLPGGPGTQVRTSINMHDQLAASAAVRAATTTRPVDVVAIQPSTGRVLAVIERPGGFDRALQGVFPPGSTFKVVTASALSGTGLRPASTRAVPGPGERRGRVFHNFDNEHLGATSLQTAFAVSCNSTFITLATQRLNGATLASTAALFGFNSQPSLGIPATLGRFTTPQHAGGPGGRRLRPGNRPGQPAQPGIHGGRGRRRHLAPAAARPQPGAQADRPAAAARLHGAGHAAPDDAGGGHHRHRGQRRFPGRGLGKTGTAEFGSAQNPRAHAWFVGYRGDLAFAVLVEGGGVGADASAPIANAFLRNL
mgnify:CR=1 FL=1